MIAILFVLALLAAMLIAFLVIAGISACMLSSEISQDEERKMFNELHSR